MYTCPSKANWPQQLPALGCEPEVERHQGEGEEEEVGSNSAIYGGYATI